MLLDYLPILIFIAFGLGLGVALIGVGSLVSPYKPTKEKSSAYECGFAPYENARIPFDVRFYLVAILFIIFDLETAFFFPWAIALTDIGWSGFIAMMIFLGLLVIGFIYEWKKGALEWE